MSGFEEEIEYPELQKFNGKLYTLNMSGMVGFAKKLNLQYSGNSMGNSIQYMFGMPGFPEKLNILNSENSTGNCIHYIRTERLDLQKNCVRYMYVMSGFPKKLNVQNSINSTENSVHYTYGMFGFEEKLISIAAQIL